MTQRLKEDKKNENRKEIATSQRRAKKQERLKIEANQREGTKQNREDSDILGKKSVKTRIVKRNQEAKQIEQKREMNWRKLGRVNNETNQDVKAAGRHEKRKPRKSLNEIMNSKRKQHSYLRKSETPKY